MILFGNSETTTVSCGRGWVSNNMANTEFSEFSYGYALTDSLIRTLFPGLSRAPVFPSLFAEGSAGGGYDVQIPRYPVPLFLQFKIPRVITRWSRLAPPRYTTPYYRMSLRTKAPNQHELLLKLENKTPLVYYATPIFHTVFELDRYFAQKVVHEYSLFLKPSAIGVLNDDAHHVAYSTRDPVCWCRSEPKVVEPVFKGVEFLATVGRATRELRNIEAADVLKTLWDRLVELISPAHVIRADVSELYDFPHDDIHELARRIAYLAQVRLDVTFALLDTE